MSKRRKRWVEGPWGCRPMPEDVKRGDLRYMNEFVRLRCAPDLLTLGLFPNMKEVTESFAAYSAVREWHPPLSDPSIKMVAIGDGTKPRTASTFAFRSAWECYSVDPELQLSWKWRQVARLHVIPTLIEDFHLESDSPVVIVAVHSHASLATAVATVDAPVKMVVAIPCCKSQALDREPDFIYTDPGIWSAKNEIHGWFLTDAAEWNGRPRRAHNPEIAGSTPVAATSGALA